MKIRIKKNKAVNASRLLSLLIASLLSTGALAETEPADANAANLGLSDYRHFVIYPHLEKALKAQKNNDEKTALSEFEYIHKQEPNNVPIALYLAEAYRHFGHNDRASQLLNEQLKRNPKDARLQQSLEAIPVKSEVVSTVAELIAQQKRCDAEPSVRCRSEVGQNALRLGELNIARQQLHDRNFSAQPQGEALRSGIVQRAIYLKQWHIADEMFSQRQQQKQLSAVEQRQWFDVLMAGQLDDRIQALQSQGMFNSANDQIAYAGALANRNDSARLQRYLSGTQPTFNTAEQEKSWLYLLSRYSANPEQSFATYCVQFPENQPYLVGATLPAALKAGDYAAARAILDKLPDNEMLDERYTVSLAMNDSQETLRLARQIYARNPADLKRLDQLTWQLMKVGQSREAANLLLQRYPFNGDSAMARTLTGRIFDLLRKHPDWATPEQMTRLSQPLPSASQRELQSQLPGVAQDCATVRRLLGDMSPNYSAASWSLLAGCYRDDLPGMALYAYQQGEARQADIWHRRSVAYQAYQVQDYATAMRARKTLTLGEMSNEDLVAAANTAQASSDAESRDLWLAEEQKRGLDNTEHYWWLHAQRYLPEEPKLALADFDRAIAAEPTARAYSSRAAVYRELDNSQAAVDDLRQALILEPENSATQAALGYALWDNDEIAQSREMLEKAHKTIPDDPGLIKQLAYVSQRLDDIPATQDYARQVIDDIDNMAQVDPLTEEQNQQRFNFRRLHEDIARRWTFNFDSSIGLRSGALSSANNNLGGASTGQSYRSYGQIEAEYRIGRNMLLDGDLLAVYSRVFADTGESGAVLPVKNPMWGTGLRWKPLRDYVFFLAVEQQVPLNNHHGESDTMLRASASFFNGGDFSDDWHPNGNGWFAQNLYLDAAHYIRQDNQAWTADYRVSWHQKVAEGQTVEPYTHVQANGYRDDYSRGTQLGGLGVRWNIWTGETHYDAWPHKISLGVEYQHTFKTINQTAGERNNAFVTIGVHW